MAHRVFERVAVLQIGHLLVPVVCANATQVRPRDERFGRADDQPRLEDEGFVLDEVLLGLAMIDEEDRDRARPGPEASGRLACQARS